MSEEWKYPFRNEDRMTEKINLAELKEDIKKAEEKWTPSGSLAIGIYALKAIIEDLEMAKEALKVIAKLNFKNQSLDQIVYEDIRRAREAISRMRTV
mgnify:CR=1 FL=1